MPTCFLRGVLDSKSLTDRFEAVGYETRKRINGGGSISLENRDRLGGGGYTSLNAMAYHGTLNLRDAMSQAFDKPPFGYDTEGGFSKFTLQFARLQYLAPKFSLFVGGGICSAAESGYLRKAVLERAKGGTRICHR